MNTRGTRPVWFGALLLCILVLVWLSRRILLLVFAALLIALVLTSFTNFLRRFVPIGHKTAYASVLLLIAGSIALASILLAPRASKQFGDLAERIPQQVTELQARLEQTSFFRAADSYLPALQDLFPQGSAAGVTKVFSSTFQMATSFVFVLFTAIFIAAAPDLYRRMVLRLFPKPARPSAEDTIKRSVCTLKSWLLGQLAAMLAVGIITAIALSLAGVPFAIPLGIISGLSEFLPFIGPILAAIPALLLAMSEGTEKVVIVGCIFLGIQFIEGNLVQPLVQRQAVNLPPVITLLALLVFGEAFGILGMFVAAPFAAVAIVLIEDLYLKRQLNSDERLSE